MIYLMLISFLNEVVITYIYIIHSPKIFSIGNTSIIYKYQTVFVNRSVSIHSESFHQCGTWQENYVKLHQSILNNRSSPRYLVSVSEKGGLADRMFGTLTEFVFALLTDRAFQLITYGTLPRFQAAFSAPNINWSRPTDDDSLINNLKFTYRSQRGYVGDRSYPPNIDTNLHWPMYLINADQDNEFFVSSNVSTYPLNHTNVRTLFVTSNRGRIVRLFDNPYHRTQLFRMGLRAHTAFQCFFDFFFAPLPALLTAMSREFSVLPSTDALKIAINVRVGDRTFDPQYDATVQIESYEQYFKCALDVESFAKHPNQKVIWCFTSDSLRLRQLAKQKYGEKVLTEENRRYYHGDCGDTPWKSYGNCTEENRDASIIMAAGQIYAMTMCDYHVISLMSGFGQLAVTLSNEWHSTFRVHKKNRRCLKNDYDKFEDIAYEGAGV